MPSINRSERNGMSCCFQGLLTTTFAEQEGVDQLGGRSDTPTSVGLEMPLAGGSCKRKAKGSAESQIKKRNQLAALPAIVTTVLGTELGTTLL
jgi:hypothetical protein